MQKRRGKSRTMHSWVRELLSFSLLSLSAVFFVVDPMGALPVFVAMTQRDTDEKREQMARRASITAFVILTLFAVAGTVIFRLLGVTLGAFKVAGGILLLLTSIEMLRAQQVRTRIIPEEEQASAEKDRAALFPPAIPRSAVPVGPATATPQLG